MMKKEKFMMIPVLKKNTTLSYLVYKKIFLGAMDDDDLAMGIDDWYDYCKKMFRKVTKNDLIEFENKYKGRKNDVKYWFYWI
jgi:hypothetical protein